MGTLAEKFAQRFAALTGYAPFPWQWKLYERFVAGAAGNIPSVCDIPTGLGKTSVIAVWLLALLDRPDVMPRRLVYVVNRRTVVDQTTNEIMKLRERLTDPEKSASIQREHVPMLKAMAAELESRCATPPATPSATPLAISTLRGQFADNREWSVDPTRPAVICGTVDMIGSRLLFSGYGVGYKSRPLHAAFLGQDTLLVHDEAHLEPAFQELLNQIQAEQRRERQNARPLPWPQLRVMELTATTRRDNVQPADEVSDEEPFALTSEEREPPDDIPAPAAGEPPIHHVWRRLRARKALRLHDCPQDKQADRIATLALEHRDADAAVLIFVRTLDDVKKVFDRLTNKKTGVPAERVRALTGTMRGLERDRMADPRQKEARVFARFLRPPAPGTPEADQWIEPVRGTVYLVCTSAGEVGIDISADHMVCDLSTFDSMAQRFGRVNRYGVRDDTCIDVVHPPSFGKVDKKTGELAADEIDRCRKRTLDLLKELNGDASPLALSKLKDRSDLSTTDAFAPPPATLVATDIHFDAWALTTIRGSMPGRPPVERFLHGMAEWEPPRTMVAWRDEVGLIQGELLKRYPPEELLDDYPLKPHELLSETSERVYKALETIHKRLGDNIPVWIVSEHNEVEPVPLGELLKSNKKRVLERIENHTLLLPPSAGGLDQKGMLDGSSPDVKDESKIPAPEVQRRVRIKSDKPETSEDVTRMRLIRRIVLKEDGADEDEPVTWDWYETLPLEGGRTSSKPVTLDTHVDDVVHLMRDIVEKLSLPAELAEALIIAARLHDLGKRREHFQRTLGNRQYPDVLLAKSASRGAASFPEIFRHEFASVLDAMDDESWRQLSDEMRALVLHLIAAHHGRGRPHFPPEEVFDPARPEEEAHALACDTPRRFARLQRRYGRWGLAYIESLLRAADWAASAKPSASLAEEEVKS